MPKQSTFIIIASFCVRISWQYIFAIRQIRSYVIDFICKLKSLGLDCLDLPKASLAMTISSSDSHKFKSHGLDTSLRINATLSMTKMRTHAVILNESNLRFVILRALARSIHFGDLKPKAIRLLCANLNAVALIRFYVIAFICKLDSRVLDTSLHCVSLSMTNYCHKKKNSVILRALARSIHFSDLRIAKDSLTLGESIYLTFTRFATLHTTFKGIQMQT